MDKLPDKQRTDISRMFTARIFIKLTRLGLSEETLSSLERAELWQMYAELVATGRDQVPLLQAKQSVMILKSKNSRLGFEMKKFQNELAIRQQELDLKKVELPIRKDNEIESNEIKRRQSERDRLETARHNSIVSRTKAFSQALSKSLPRMPTDPIDLPGFFQNIEHLFHSFEMPENVQSSLLCSCLSDKARFLITRMDIDKVDDYPAVKQYLLAQFQLSPQTYRLRFINAEKQADETYMLFSTRVRTLLEYYLQGREVSTIDTFISLMVADHIKGTLSEACLRHVLAIESK